MHAARRRCEPLTLPGRRGRRVCRQAALLLTAPCRIREMSSSAVLRRAGLAVPLFSCPSTTSWGIGDIGDLVPLTRWLSGAGQRVLQLLPLNEMAPSQSSPYSAISAMALDPIFIRLPDVPEFAASGGEASLSTADRTRLAVVR